MPEMTYTERLTVVSCTCGMSYAIPATLNQQLLDHCGPNGKSTYCPSGHRWHYLGKSAEERVRAAEQRTKAVRDLLHAEELSHRATKGHLTKAKRRVHRGVCLHCNRTFADLARHMGTKHPEEVATT